MVSNEYHLIFFEQESGRRPVQEYLDTLPQKEQQKIAGLLELTRELGGRSAYTKSIGNGLREFKVQWGRKEHRILFVTTKGKSIVLLHAFLKKTQKLPATDKKMALNRFREYQITYKKYGDKLRKMGQ